MKDLNNQQQRAVEAGDGPLLIVAGPGTGKTKTLTARIAYLLREGRAKPQQILALTFTKKAAQEMGRRVAELAPGPQPYISTFHALCHELLGEGAEFIGDAARLQLIKSLPRPQGLKGLSGRELALIISRAKNDTQVDDPDVAKIVRAYNKALKSQNRRDFDDLLLDAYTLLKQNDAARQKVQTRFAHILVDEFQDTNRLQYELLKLLRAHDNLLVIGDPNQSIYGFRGASGDIFGQFAADFPAHTAITLDINYRSTLPIVRLANALFKGAPDLTAQSDEPGKVRAVQVLNEYGEARWVINQIQRAIGGDDLQRAVSDDMRSAHRRLSDFAVLYRNRPAALTFQKLLNESGLPYQVVGDGSPYDQPHIQAIITLLTTALKREPITLEGYGSAVVRLLEQELSKVHDARPAVLAEKIVSILGLEPSRELQQFVSTLVRFKDVASAVSYFDTIAQSEFYDASADAITLLTIHAAKGLEFPQVFVLAAEEGVLPSARGDASEEHRLFYVAVTRARDRLEILHAKNRGGQKAEPSRFLTPLIQDILPRHTDPDIDNQVRRIAKRAAKNSQTSLF